LLFTGIYIFSPSIEVDSSWIPVKKYITDHMKVVHTEEEPIYVDHYDPKALHDIFYIQHKQILIILERKIIKSFFKYKKL